MNIAIYPGSFDPITLGHVDIVTRASKLFRRLLLGVAHNPGKQALLPVQERVKLAEACIGHLDNVEVQSFDGLTVRFAEQHGASVIIRGLRAVSDFEFEFMMSQMNKTLRPNLETMFMMAGIDYQFLSSSMVKEVAALGGDISALVPPQVKQYFETLTR